MGRCRGAREPHCRQGRHARVGKPRRPVWVDQGHIWKGHRAHRQDSSPHCLAPLYRHCAAARAPRATRGACCTGRPQQAAPRAGRRDAQCLHCHLHHPRQGPGLSRGATSLSGEIAWQPPGDTRLSQQVQRPARARVEATEHTHRQGLARCDHASARRQHDSAQQPAFAPGRGRAAATIQAFL